MTSLTYLLYKTENFQILKLPSLRSWRYCVGARLKFWRWSRVPKKGSRDEAVEIPPAVFVAASPLVTAPPSNLTRLYYFGSAAKSHSTTTQYRLLRRLQITSQLGFSTKTKHLSYPLDSDKRNSLLQENCLFNQKYTKAEAPIFKGGRHSVEDEECA